MLPDEDVKIYSIEVEADEPMGEGERSAVTFLQHKENGNLTKCRELGNLLGTAFVDAAGQYTGDPYVKQRLSLLSFIISDELAGIIFDQFLQKSALSVFQQTVEQLDRSLVDAISDSTSYTLYIMDDHNSTDGGLGATFAELCDRDGDSELIDSANSMVDKYRTICGDIISGYDFLSVD